MPDSTAKVDNWIRLGLVEASYHDHLASDDAYNWVQSRPEYKEARAIHETEKAKVIFEKGRFFQTSFGMQFARIVGVMPRDDASAKKNREAHEGTEEQRADDMDKA